MKAFEYRQKILLTDPTRDVGVIVLQGKTRLGKSTFCRVWSKNHNKIICFLSAGKDFFGEYLGQDIYVFDDFNYENVTINNFKQIIDPHINSAIGSRYQNKLFLGDTIFIYTNQAITSWFPLEKDPDRTAVFERISYVLDFKSYEELTNSSDLSFFEISKIPKYSEGVLYYTVNKIIPTDTYTDVLDKFDCVANRYRDWNLQPVEEGIRET